MSRTLGRELSQVQGSSALDLARIDAAAQRREAVTDGVTAVAGRAMQHIALVAQAEQQLALVVPQASGRLAAIADMHGLAMSSILMDAARALGRLA